MKRNRIYLTGVGEVLKKEAEKKLENLDTESEPKCENGHTAEFYDSLGMDLPEDLIKKLKVKKGDLDIELDNDDFEEVYSDIVIYEDDIKLFITDAEGTTVFLQEGMSVSVIETAAEIDEYLDYINRPVLVKILDSIKYFISKTQ